MGHRRLIINADGYGFTPGVNEGVVRTFEAGLVRSTSCTPNFGHLGQVGEVARRFPKVSFGIHFNLSMGPPVTDPSKVPTLVDESGRFWEGDLFRRILRRKIDRQDMVRELTAQAALLADAGVKISHWDGHQNKHLYPPFFEVALEVGKRFGIRGIRTHRRLLYTTRGPAAVSELAPYYLRHPARALTHLGGRLRSRQANRHGYRTADRLITPGYADHSHKSASSFWFTLAETLPAGTSEIYCHPGFPDDLLRANAKYVDEREHEVAVLTDPVLREAFEAASIRSISFLEL